MNTAPVSPGWNLAVWLAGRVTARPPASEAPCQRGATSVRRSKSAGVRGPGVQTGHVPRTGPAAASGMSVARDRCPACTKLLISSRFDATFRLPDQSERLCFGIPGGLCADCHQLYIDPDLIELLDLGPGRCTFAIESDLVLQERAWSM